MSVSCDCCVLSGRGLCIRLITRLEDSECGVYRCDRETSVMRRHWSTRGCSAVGKKMNVQEIIAVYSQNQVKLHRGNMQ